MKKLTQFSPVEIFLFDWLSGTTCAFKIPDKRTILWQSKCGRFVVLKHQGHSEYCGRGSGTVWCETYHHLYDITLPVPSGSLGRHAQDPLMTVDGRWSKKHQAEAEAIVAGYA